MLKQLYSVRDNVACYFNNMWVAHNEDHAKRQMADALAQDQNNAMSQHPEDFHLYQMGTYNDNDGTVNTVDCPRRIIVLSDLLKGTQLDQAPSGNPE